MDICSIQNYIYIYQIDINYIYISDIYKIDISDTNAGDSHIQTAPALISGWMSSKSLVALVARSRNGKRETGEARLG